jgi:hypothetical protein
MKKILNYLPTWQNIKRFFNVIYYSGFSIWVLLHSYVVAFEQYQITNNEIFTALMFMFFMILDSIDLIKEKK